MIKVQVVTYGIPEDVAASDSCLGEKETKLLKLSRVPAKGEWLVWRNQNFKITKVIHSPDSTAYAAVVEAQWCESL